MHENLRPVSKSIMTKKPQIKFYMYIESNYQSKLSNTSFALTKELYEQFLCLFKFNDKTSLSFSMQIPKKKKKKKKKNKKKQKK